MRLSWDGIGVRLFRAGIDRGVLYPLHEDGYGTGIAWNGLTGIDDGNTGHDKVFLYTNDRRSAVLFTPYDHGGTIKCFTYPDEFESCIGNDQIVPGLYASAQEQTPFGLCYRIRIGNDTQSINYAYEIHIVYGAYVSEAKTNVSTIGSEAKAQEMAFGYESVVEEALNNEPTAHMIINSRFVSEEGLRTIENILYGDDSNEPRLLLPDELYDILYQTQPIPEEYKYYPHEFRYPSSDVYPLNQETS